LGPGDRRRVKVRLNGADRETGAETVAKLLEELGLPPQTVLVEQNGEALGRDQWDGARLQEGDGIEVLRVAAGG
jgi:thiamine biosynthesis protein ThiS